ncbi:Homeobox protein knotted-1 protein, partial [Thalictrum thalictroides]
VGAPPEVITRLEEACASEEAMSTVGRSNLGEDPGLDQFMEAYCEMLVKYEQELSKPFKEAMLFLSRIESQFKALTVGSSDSGDDPFLISLIFLLFNAHRVYFLLEGDRLYILIS